MEAQPLGDPGWGAEGAGSPSTPPSAFPAPIGHCQAPSAPLSQVPGSPTDSPCRPRLGRGGGGCGALGPRASGAAGAAGGREAGTAAGAGSRQPRRLPKPALGPVGGLRSRGVPHGQPPRPPGLPAWWGAPGRHRLAMGEGLAGPRATPCSGETLPAAPPPPSSQGGHRWGWGQSEASSRWELALSEGGVGGGFLPHCADIYPLPLPTTGVLGLPLGTGGEPITGPTELLWVGPRERRSLAQPSARPWDARHPRN